jgi:hypothetical protein
MLRSVALLFIVVAILIIVIIIIIVLLSWLVMFLWLLVMMVWPILIVIIIIVLYMFLRWSIVLRVAVTVRLSVAVMFLDNGGGHGGLNLLISILVLDVLISDFLVGVLRITIILTLPMLPSTTGTARPAAKATLWLPDHAIVSMIGKTALWYTWRVILTNEAVTFPLVAGGTLPTSKSLTPWVTVARVFADVAIGAAIEALMLGSDSMGAEWEMPRRNGSRQSSEDESGLHVYNECLRRKWKGCGTCQEENSICDDDGST